MSANRRSRAKLLRVYPHRSAVFSIRQCSPPEGSLILADLGPHPERWRGYRDCFRVVVPQAVDLSLFVAAFYTSGLFKLERLLLALFLSLPSRDVEAHALAAGTRHEFAAWYAGARTSHELLMCDRFENTRSWFKATPLVGGGSELCFGSAVATRTRDASRPRKFRFLVGFHVLYSQLLLRAAVSQLARRRP